ncbi:MAG: DUF4403 family protein [Paludibacteraceae bacterium]|nr:DUF4403 family protein [Paludibacteraceae bacterium]
MVKKLTNTLIITILSVFNCIAQEDVESFFPTDSIDNMSLSERLDSMTEDRPEEEYEEIFYTPKTSTLHIPLDINISFLEKKLNETFNGVLYEDNNIEDDSLMVKAEKAKDFKIQYEDNVLEYQVPIKFWVKKRFDLGITYTDKEIEGAIDLKFKTTINLSKDWNIVSKTEIVNYSWIKKPVLKVGFVDVRITFIVDKIIKDNKNDIQSAIDKALNEQVPLRTYAQNLWNSVQDPIDISTADYKAWVKTTPIQIYTTPIIGYQGKINTTFGVKCLMDIYLGNAPSFIKKESILPPLTMYAKTDEQFKMNLLADVPFTLLDSMARSTMIGQTFGEGKKSVVVDSIEIFGQNDKLIVGLGVVGFINGFVYLECVPYYDQQTYSIRVKDVDYKIKTKNILAKIVNLFYKKGMKRRLEEGLTFSLRDEYHLVKDMSRSELFNMEIVPNVKLNGFVNDLNVENIFITKMGLKISMDLMGKLKITVE